MFASLTGKSLLFPRVTACVRNGLARILHAEVGLPLFGALLTVSLLFTARVADAQVFTLQDMTVAENAGTATIRIQNTSGVIRNVVSWSTSDGTAAA